MGWLLRAFITTTMLLMTTACVLRFTHSQNYVSFPVFDKFFEQTSICELIDLSMKGLTILPFIIFKRRNKLDLSATDFLLWNELEKAVELFFYFPRKKAILRGPHYTLVGLYLIFTLAYVISSLSRNLQQSVHFPLLNKR